MKPSILLYNPPATADKIKWMRNVPLNLLSICSCLDEKEFDIFINQSFAKEALNKFKPHLDNAVCLGISCMTGIQISHGLALAEMIRAINPDLPVIWGGYHPTATPEQSLQNKFVDIVVRGYGEITFPKLVHCLANNQSYKDIPGISFKEDGKIISNPDGQTPNFDDLPSLPYHLVDVKKILKGSGTRLLHYVSSRGCPHRCGFCADRVIYKSKWNPLSAERVLSDLERLKKDYDYDAVRFFDSNLFVDEKRIRDICIGVIEKKLNFKWIRCNGDTYNLVKYSSETLQLMHKAGVFNILLGFESGYAPALRCISKAATPEQNLKVVKLLHEHNINIGFSLMFGFPYDLPVEELATEHQKELIATMKTVAQLSDLHIPGDYYLLFPFTPYPGVKLFSRYRELGYKPPNSLEGWTTTNLDESNSCVWISPSLLKQHHNCLNILWFFMHKLDRNIFMGSKKPLLRKYAKFCDELACKTLKKRIDRSRLSLPFILRVVMIYIKIRNALQTKGFKKVVSRVFLKINPCK